jgi:hypothetical protein
VRELHGDGTLAHRRSHALYRAVAHIAGHKNSRHADSSRNGSRGSFQLRQLAVDAQIRPGQHESVLIAQDARWQPRRTPGAAPMKTNSEVAGTTVSPFGPANATLPGALAQASSTCVCASNTIFDVASSISSIKYFDMVAEIPAAHQHGYLAGEFGEVEGGLAGGVGAADDKDLFVLAGGGLNQGGAVVDAASGEACRAGEIELAVVDAGASSTTRGWRLRGRRRAARSGIGRRCAGRWRAG